MTHEATQSSDVPVCTYPLITATMITGKCPARYDMARVAVWAFLQQTYPNRRLVIVNHGERTLVNAWPPADWVKHPDHRVSVIEHRVVKAETDTLGDLRNASLRFAGSGLVAVWDDDDYARDDYLMTMYQAYKPGHAVLMQHQIRHDLVNNRSCVRSVKTGHVGQSLFQISEANFNMYRSHDRHEDAIMLKDHFGSRIVVVDNDPCMYIRNYHGENVFGDRHILGFAVRLRSGEHMLPASMVGYVQRMRRLYGK